MTLKAIAYVRTYKFKDSPIRKPAQIPDEMKEWINSRYRAQMDRLHYYDLAPEKVQLGVHAIMCSGLYCSSEAACGRRVHAFWNDAMAEVIGQSPGEWPYAEGLRRTQFGLVCWDHSKDINAFPIHGVVDVDRLVFDGRFRLRIRSLHRSMTTGGSGSPGTSSWPRCAVAPACSVRNSEMT